MVMFKLNSRIITDMMDDKLELFRWVYAEKKRLTRELSGDLGSIGINGWYYDVFVGFEYPDGTT